MDLHLRLIAPLVLAAAATLTACMPPPGSSIRSHVVQWPERQLLLAGDGGSGDVRVFRLIGERPVPVGIWRSAGRTQVLGIHVDRECGGVWIQGDRSLALHSPESGAAIATFGWVPGRRPSIAEAGDPGCGGRLALAQGGG